MRFFLFSGAFWGLFLIAIGVAVMAKHIFHLDFPIGRIIWALLLIMLGIQFLVGFSFRNEPGMALFSDSKLKYEEGRYEYNALFGKATLDLSDLPAGEEVRVKATAVFGEMIVKVNDSANVIVRGSSVFGNATVPDGGNASFGEITWKSASYDASNPALKLKAESVFGQVTVLR